MDEFSDKLKNLTAEQKQKLIQRLKEKGIKGVGYEKNIQSLNFNTFKKGENFAYKIKFPPDFSRSEFITKEIFEPEADMVQLEVKAASLNFRDLMIAMGMYPATPGIPSVMGSDYAGVVTKVGESVENFHVGDKVMVLSAGSLNSDYSIDSESHFSKYQTVEKHQVFPMPQNSSFIEAACIPTVFITSYYALIKAGQIKKEDVVLVHSATGGVGLAAIEICKWKGCEIFATAGNEAKREMLKARGISLVMNSRNPGFEKEIMEYTNGRGVDVILNTLSGENMIAGLNTLTFFGRFLQIDKKDIALNNTLNLGVFNKGISFSAIDIGLLTRDFKMINALFIELNQLFSDGNICPIRYKVYPYQQLGEALNFMSRSEHIGKLVIDFQI
jgi:NADPH:quinone reductase-like Zn-dependent oxidoreductase